MNVIDGGFSIFFVLMIMHALCDFPLQGDFLGKGKIPANSFESGSWLICLLAHCLIQAGGVLLVLGFRFALAELIIHLLIDSAKIAGWTNFKIDQTLHVLTKLFYVVIILR